MNITELETQAIMLAVSGSGNDSNNEDWAPQRRGTWGNLWSDTTE